MCVKYHWYRKTYTSRENLNIFYMCIFFKSKTLSSYKFLQQKKRSPTQPLEYPWKIKMHSSLRYPSSSLKKKKRNSDDDWKLIAVISLSTPTNNGPDKSTTTAISLSKHSNGYSNHYSQNNSPSPDHAQCHANKHYTTQNLIFSIDTSTLPTPNFLNPITITAYDKIEKVKKKYRKRNKMEYMIEI